MILRGSLFRLSGGLCEVDLVILRLSIFACEFFLLTDVGNVTLILVPATDGAAMPYLSLIWP
jgi:hypothetical protein